MLKKNQFTSSELSDMTMDLLLKRLTEESPHLSNPQYGNGILEVIYNFNSVPRIIDSYSIMKDNSGEIKIIFPSRKYDLNLLKKNIRVLYNVIQKYLAIRVVPQGKITIEFKNGIVDGFEVSNEGTYKDLERTGKPKMNLDEILFGDDV